MKTLRKETFVSVDSQVHELASQSANFIQLDDVEQISDVQIVVNQSESDSNFPAEYEEEDDDNLSQKVAIPSEVLDDIAVTEQKCLLVFLLLNQLPICLFSLERIARGSLEEIYDSLFDLADVLLSIHANDYSQHLVAYLLDLHHLKNNKRKVFEVALRYSASCTGYVHH